MSDNNWLERELTGQLAPVAAPATLWFRIHARTEAGRRLSFSAVLWPSMAVLVLTIATAAALHRTPHPDDFTSSSPEAIRQWTLDRAGLDVVFPENQHPRKYERPADETLRYSRRRHYLPYRRRYGNFAGHPQGNPKAIHSKCKDAGFRTQIHQYSIRK